jgi:hypothetical protein
METIVGYSKSQTKSEKYGAKWFRGSVSGLDPKVHLSNFGHDNGSPFIFFLSLSRQIVPRLFQLIMLLLF